jgi:DNA polymerase-2
VFDIVPSGDGVTVWFRDEAGETAPLRAPFRPSFVLAGRAVRRGMVEAAARRWGCDVSPREGTDLFSGETLPAWTVTVPRVDALRETVRKAERAFGPDALCDADIPAEQQFAHASGLHPLARAEVDLSPGGVLLSARVLDSPWDADAPLPAFTEVRLAAAGTGHPAHGRERPLELEADGRTHVLPWESGADLLREIQRLLDACDPDLLVTSYGDDFILPRLLALAARLRFPLRLGRKGPAARAAGSDVRRTRERSYFSYGQVVFRAAGHHLEGRWHVDARNSFLYADTGLPGLIELSRLSGIPLQRMARSSPGTAISAMQAAQAMRRGVLVPFRKREPEGFKTALSLVETDKGGLTYLPRPGLHGTVGELDFASMYPSLMVRYNISPETVNCRCCPGDAIPVPGISARTCRRRRGLVPETIAPVLARRALLKGRQKVAGDPAERETLRQRQTALKWLLVVCFGFLGYRNARFGRIEAHEATTAWGREKLLSAKEVAEDAGFSFLHGLTDAIWVEREDAEEDDYRRLGEAITEATGMPIALEGVYRWIAFLPSKANPRLGVPNRFVGAFADGTIKARGIAMRRSDTPPFIADFQRELLRRMAEARGIGELHAMLPELREAVEAAALELREGRVPPEALSVSRRLSREPQRYVAQGAAAGVARELSGRGVALRPGSRIRYLLPAEGGRPPRGGPGAGRPPPGAGRTAGGAGKQHGRAAGFLDGSESPDLRRYEAMLRDAAEELLGPLLPATEIGSRRRCGPTQDGNGPAPTADSRVRGIDAAVDAFDTIFPGTPTRGPVKPAGFLFPGLASPLRTHRPP